MKYLVLGSAPYMKRWAPNHLAWFYKEQYCIVAINNAWALCGEACPHQWHRSNDFYETGTLIPERPEDRFDLVVGHTTRNNYRHMYLRYKRGGTMFFNVLYWILANEKNVEEVAVAGCDFVYGDRISFYDDLPNSRANVDPLARYSPSELTEEVRHSQRKYFDYGIELLNAGGRYLSLLTYPRLEEHRLYQ